MRHLTQEGMKEIAHAYWNVIHPSGDEDLTKKLEEKLNELEAESDE